MKKERESSFLITIFSETKSFIRFMKNGFRKREITIKTYEKDIVKELKKNQQMKYFFNDPKSKIRIFELTNLGKKGLNLLQYREDLEKKCISLRKLALKRAKSRS